MTPDGIKERFEFYRKWFRTLLVKEFMNLPSKYQERFMQTLKEFTEDCQKVLEENKVIKERIIRLTVTDIISAEDQNQSYIICGKSIDLQDEIRMSVPITKPKPRLGAKLYHTVFSLDEVIWYSSKEELITRSNS